MTAMHTDDERAYLLRLAGVKDADAATLVRTPQFVIDEEPTVDDLAVETQNDEPSSDCGVCGGGGWLFEQNSPDSNANCPACNDTDETPPDSADGRVEMLVQAILAKSKGDKATALRIVDVQVRAEFDRIKLSKLQAAAQGLTTDGKTEHNRNAWARCQKLGEQMKAAVREHHRVNGGFVTAKIRGGEGR